MPWEDHKVNWDKEGGISRILEHFKIIDEGNFTKNKVNQIISIFGAFLVHRMLRKIVVDTKTRKESYSKQI